MLQKWDGLVEEATHKSHDFCVKFGPVVEVDFVELGAHPIEGVCLSGVVCVIAPHLVQFSELHLNRVAKLPQSDRKVRDQCRFHWWLFVSTYPPQEVVEEGDGAAVCLAHLVRC